VPFFVLLTGFLNTHKKLSANYYKGIIKILAIYVLACLACILFKRFFLLETIGIADAVKSIFDFSAAPYAWYVEMYVGLFLLIPFLNILWGGVKSKRHKQILIGVLILMTALPSLINFHAKILPDFWAALWPLSYYFIGAYLKNYKIAIKPIRKVFLIAVSLLANTLIGLWLSSKTPGQIWSWDVTSAWGGICVLVYSMLLFSLLLDLKWLKVPRWSRSVITKVASLSFGMYLVSYIFDILVYQHILPAGPDYFPGNLVYFPLAPILVFIGSFVLSWVIQSIYSVFSKCLLEFKEGLKD
jgi:surface polysaccharide O-acyltransferase-like enzyme